MKFDYTYKVQLLNPDGMATVEYVNEKLGSVTKAFFIPYHLGEEQIHRRIVERFPLDNFYQKYLARNPGEPPEIIRGTMSIDFDDHFYDTQVMTTEMLP